MNIVFMMSGSIASAKATGLISMWAKSGHQVKVVASPSALEFVGIATLEGLSNNKVITSVFEQDQMMEHINISRWADKIVLVPATANTINKLATGIADDMITSTWIAALELKKPMYIIPAMNSMMWNYPATKASIAKLKDWGITILSPQSGTLACGETGDGRMMEINDIDAIIMPKNKQNILITAGGTKEYIDGVRYIGNSSTGKTGAQIADYFTSHGYNVTWLGAKDALLPKLACTKVFYETFDDIQKQLQQQLKQTNFSTIIHAAAISDFSVVSIKINNQNIITSRNIKLPTADAMSIKLKKNPKLVSQLKHWSINKDIQVIAFKLTNSKDKDERLKAINKLLDNNAINFVAHNDLSEISSDQHLFNFYQKKQKVKACANTKELCDNINLFLKEKIA